MCASQGRHHRHSWSPSNPSCQASNIHDSHCDGAGPRSCWKRFVASLARPGGNITGLSSLAPELSGKQLELMKEIAPRLSHVAVFGTSTNSGNAQTLREVELAAKTFGVELQYLDVLSPKDIETAFRAASKGRADAVLMLPGPVLVLQRAHLAADLAVKSRPRQFTHKRNIRKPAASCTMALTLRICSGAPRLTWIRF